MTGTNHMVTGALIGSAVSAPELALPLAFVSHFMLDILPHYGDDSISWASKRYKIVIGMDTAIAVSFSFLIIVAHPARWPFMLLGGILAMAPDLMWLPNYIRTMRGIEQRSLNVIMRLHKKIQWGERPWGLVIEAMWFIVIAPLFYFALAK